MIDTQKLRDTAASAKELTLMSVIEYPRATLEHLQGLADLVTACCAELDAKQSEVAWLVEAQFRYIDGINMRKEEAEQLRGLLAELFSLVHGECPSLLDEDSGGDSGLDLRIHAALHGETSGS